MKAKIIGHKSSFTVDDDTQYRIGYINTASGGKVGNECSLVASTSEVTAIACQFATAPTIEQAARILQAMQAGLDRIFKEQHITESCPWPIVDVRDLMQGVDGIPPLYAEPQEATNSHDGDGGAAFRKAMESKNQALPESILLANQWQKSLVRERTDSWRNVNYPTIAFDLAKEGFESELVSIQTGERIKWNPQTQGLEDFLVLGCDVLEGKRDTMDGPRKDEDKDEVLRKVGWDMAQCSDSKKLVYTHAKVHGEVWCMRNFWYFTYPNGKETNTEPYQPDHDGSFFTWLDGLTQAHCVATKTEQSNEVIDRTRPLDAKSLDIAGWRRVQAPMAALMPVWERGDIQLQMHHDDKHHIAHVDGYHESNVYHILKTVGDLENFVAAFEARRIALKPKESSAPVKTEQPANINTDAESSDSIRTEQPIQTLIDNGWSWNEPKNRWEKQDTDATVHFEENMWIACIGPSFSGGYRLGIVFEPEESTFLDWLLYRVQFEQSKIEQDHIKTENLKPMPEDTISTQALLDSGWDQYNAPHNLNLFRKKREDGLIVHLKHKDGIVTRLGVLGKTGGKVRIISMHHLNRIVALQKPAPDYPSSKVEDLAYRQEVLQALGWESKGDPTWVHSVTGRVIHLWTSHSLEKLPKANNYHDPKKQSFAAWAAEVTGKAQSQAEPATEVAESPESILARLGWLDRGGNKWRHPGAVNETITKDEQGDWTLRSGQSMRINLTWRPKKHSFADWLAEVATPTRAYGSFLYLDDIHEIEAKIKSLEAIKDYIEHLRDGEFKQGSKAWVKIDDKIKLIKTHLSELENKLPNA